MKENNILEKYKKIGIIFIIITIVCMVVAIIKITDKEVSILSLCIFALGFFTIFFSVILLNWRKELIKSIETKKNITNATKKEKKNTQILLSFADTIISYEKSLKQITMMSAIHLVIIIMITIFLFI